MTAMQRGLISTTLTNACVSRETRSRKVGLGPRSLLSCIFLTLSMAMPYPAIAAIHKCTGTDGKVVFSDQPCESGQSATIIKGAATPAPGAAPVKSGTPTDPNAAMTSMRNSIDAALTPECRQMRTQLQPQTLETKGGRLTDLELDNLVARFDLQCIPLIKAAQAAEWAKGKAERDTLQKKTECNDKRRVYNERKDKLPSLDDSGRLAMAKLATDLELNCR